MKRITILVLLVALAGTFVLINYYNSNDEFVYSSYTITYSEDNFAPAIDYNKISYANQVPSRMGTEDLANSYQFSKGGSSLDFQGNVNVKTNTKSSKITNQTNVNFYADGGTGTSLDRKNRVNSSNGGNNIILSPVSGLIASHASGATSKYTPIVGGPSFTSTSDLYNSNAFSNDDDEDDLFPDDGADKDPDDGFVDSPISSSILSILFMALAYVVNVTRRKRKTDF